MPPGLPRRRLTGWLSFQVFEEPAETMPLKIVFPFVSVSFTQQSWTAVSLMTTSSLTGLTEGDAAGLGDAGGVLGVACGVSDGCDAAATRCPCEGDETP